MAVNGVATGIGNESIPITGTCYETVGGGAFCNFFIGGGGMLVLDIQQSLNGTIRTLDVNQTVRDSGLITLPSIR